MKFTATVIATLMGVAVATNTTAGNTTATTAAATPAAGVAGKASFTADIAVAFTLPTNVTASDVTGVIIPTGGFAVPTGGCTGFNGGGAVVCDMTNGFQTVVRSNSGDNMATVATTSVAAGRRARSLRESAAVRKLANTAFTFGTQMVFTTDAAAQSVAASITSDTDGTGFGGALQTALGDSYGTLSGVGVTATSDVILADGTSQTFAAAADAHAASVESDESSSAFKVAATGVVAMLLAVAQF